jgi:hypothetical protein
VIWSNEDGGTNTPALMAQWGRTTDIEWVYRVEVNARGRRVAGSGVFQSAAHGTERFHGRYDGTHPLLQTCTSNNNMCDEVTDPMRFALSMRGVLRASQAREHEMDTHPWTYRVMADELRRERKIGPSDPSSLAVGDPRTYLYVAVTHTTTPLASAALVGLAVDVKLKGVPATTYTSNHGVPAWALLRNGPAATTVELPAGTTRADLASISVRRVQPPTANSAALTVTDVPRAFFLRGSYLPRSSFLHWHGSLELTTDSPTQPIPLAP